MQIESLPTPRVDETAGRVRSSVSARVNRVLTFVHGARTVLDGFFHHNGRPTADEAPGYADRPRARSTQPIYREEQDNGGL